MGDLNNAEEREPRVVLGIRFSVNGVLIPPTELVVHGANMDSESLIEEIEKTFDEVAENIKFSMGSGLAIRNLLKGYVDVEGELLVSFTRAEVRRSFLNPEIRVGSVIVNPGLH
ncbi:MAG: hypothetical protein WCO84_01735 [bacterium]